MSGDGGWTEAMKAAAQLLREAGHDGDSCGLKGMTITLGPAGSLVDCKCGAVLWTRDLADLREIRRGIPAPAPWKGPRP